MKQANGLIEHLGRVQSRRARFERLFNDFRETALAVTEDTFSVKGIHIGDVTADSTFDVVFNHRRFRVVLTDNIEKGCGEVSAYKLDRDDKIVLPAFLQFTFNGQGVTDIPVTGGENQYDLTGGGDPVVILLNMIDQAL